MNKPEELTTRQVLRRLRNQKSYRQFACVSHDIWVGRFPGGRWWLTCDPPSVEGPEFYEAESFSEFKAFLKDYLEYYADPRWTAAKLIKKE